MHLSARVNIQVNEHQQYPPIIFSDALEGAGKCSMVESCDLFFATRSWSGMVLPSYPLFLTGKICLTGQSDEVPSFLPYLNLWCHVVCGGRDVRWWEKRLGPCVTSPDSEYSSIGKE